MALGGVEQDHGDQSTGHGLGFARAPQPQNTSSREEPESNGSTQDQLLSSGVRGSRAPHKRGSSTNIGGGRGRNQTGAQSSASGAEDDKNAGGGSGGRKGRKGALFSQRKPHATGAPVPAPTFNTPAAEASGTDSKAHGSRRSGRQWTKKQ